MQYKEKCARKKLFLDTLCLIFLICLGILALIFVYITSAGATTFNKITFSAVMLGGWDCGVFFFFFYF